MSHMVALLSGARTMLRSSIAPPQRIANPLEFPSDKRGRFRDCAPLRCLRLVIHRILMNPPSSIEVSPAVQSSQVDPAPAHTALSRHVHIPTPGDHYSPATGSAVMTVIYEIGRVHVRRGGELRIVVSRGTRHDYDVGQCIEAAPTAPIQKWQKLIDVGLSRLGMSRYFSGHQYSPSQKVLPDSESQAIFVHNAPSAIPLFRKTNGRAKVCLWVHNELFRTYRNSETQRVVDAVYRVLCVSKFIADGLMSRVRPDQHPKVRVVANGVDTDRFFPDLKPHPPQQPIILFVGRVLPEKGADLLLRAAAKIQCGGKRFKIRIVGSSNFSATDPLTDYEKSLRDLAEPLGNDVQFVPFVDRARVLDEYRGASIFCAPANWDEPFGLTIAEALACGLPSVVSNRGGIPEVAADAALYFDPPDIDQLANRLSMFLDNPALCRDYAAKARARALQLSWSNQYERLLEAIA